MEKKLTICLFDMNNVYFRAWHKFQGLTHAGKSVAGIYGLPYILRAIISKLSPDKVICVWDGGRSQHRLELHPEYKGKRKLMPNYDDFVRQKGTVMRMLKLLGIPQIKMDGQEADDIIYALVRKYKKTHKVIIVSNDKDFNQCVTEDVSVWNDNHGLIITPDNMKKLYGYHSHQALDWLILGGDTSDNIKGIRGYGEKSKALLNFFERFSSITGYVLAGEISKLPITKLLEHEFKIRQLVDLDYYYRRYIKGKVKIEYYMGRRRPKINEARFRRLCWKYAIKTFEKPSFLNTFKNLR